ncbi:hypothetical protein OG890_28830 [Streptomyces anulatus]|nr:hypothetical protein [Streptomyces anulatus]MCX4487895.1 hypothetical protein [Streptomyces anulatus]
MVPEPVPENFGGVVAAEDHRPPAPRAGSVRHQDPVLDERVTPLADPSLPDASRSHFVRDVEQDETVELQTEPCQDAVQDLGLVSVPGESLQHDPARGGQLFLKECGQTLAHEFIRKPTGVCRILLGLQPQWCPGCGLPSEEDTDGEVGKSWLGCEDRTHRRALSRCRRTDQSHHRNGRLGRFVCIVSHCFPLYRSPEIDVGPVCGDLCNPLGSERRTLLRLYTFSFAVYLIYFRPNADRVTP